MEDLNKSQEFEHANERFFEKGFERVHTVVFLIDNKNHRIAMLKRDESLDFAPNLYTGVGGKVEKSEGHREGAIRELGEELKDSEKNFNKENIQEFGRIIINEKGIISYFVLPYEEDALPETNEGIGRLEWTSFDHAMDLEIIPTTRAFMEEWKRRGWDTNKSFTVLMTRKDPNDVNSEISNIEVREGLVGEV